MLQEQILTLDSEILDDCAALRNLHDEAALMCVSIVVPHLKNEQFLTFFMLFLHLDIWARWIIYCNLFFTHIWDAQKPTQLTSFGHVDSICFAFRKGHVHLGPLRLTLIRSLTRMVLSGGRDRK